MRRCVLEDCSFCLLFTHIDVYCSSNVAKDMRKCICICVCFGRTCIIREWSISRTCLKPQSRYISLNVRHQSCSGTCLVLRLQTCSQNVSHHRPKTILHSRSIYTYIQSADYRLSFFTMCEKKVFYRWLHSASRVKRETRILPIRVGAFRPKFKGNGVIPAKVLIPFDR